MKVDAKLAELMPLTRKFANKVSLTQNSGFGAFRTVSLLHECRFKTSRNGNINADVR
jgi:hypothetical protein